MSEALKTLEIRLKNHTDKQFIYYVKSHWLESKKQPLLDMLEELDLEFDKSESMDTLIVKFRKEITDYILEAYYNG